MSTDDLDPKHSGSPKGEKVDRVRLVASAEAPRPAKREERNSKEIGSQWPLSPKLLAGICIACLLLVVSWLVVELQERFPRLPAGSYIGSIEGVFGDDAERASPLFVEATSNDEMFVVVMREGWDGQLTTGAPRGDGASSDWFHPIIINGDGKRLVFTGSVQGFESYKGSVKLSDGSEGSWTLAKAKENNSLSTSISAAEMELWLRLKADLKNVEISIGEAEVKAPEQKAEIDRLTEFVTEGDKLKARSDQKFREVQEELETVREAYQAKRAQGKDLEKQIEISEEVTKRGRLVSLSRKSLDREARWIESMLRSAVPQSSVELEQAVIRGKKIMGVKREIAIERERIYHLREAAGGPGARPAGPTTFDSIWGR